MTLNITITKSSKETLPKRKKNIMNAHQQTHTHTHTLALMPTDSHHRQTQGTTWYSHLLELQEYLHHHIKNRISSGTPL